MNSGRLDMLKIKLGQLQLDRQKVLNKLNKIDADIEMTENKLNPKIECKCCDIKIESEDKLDRHNRTYSHRIAAGEKHFNCKTCNRLYFHYGTEQEIAAQIMGQSAKKRNLDPTLTKYLEDHFGENGKCINRMECPVCPDAFFQNSSARQRHMKSKQHIDNENRGDSTDFSTDSLEENVIENVKIIDEEEIEINDWWDYTKEKVLDRDYFHWICSKYKGEDIKRELKRFAQAINKFGEDNITAKQTFSKNGSTCKFICEGNYLGDEDRGVISWTYD